MGGGKSSSPHAPPLPRSGKRRRTRTGNPEAHRKFGSTLLHDLHSIAQNSAPSPPFLCGDYLPADPAPIHTIATLR